MFDETFAEIAIYIYITQCEYVNLSKWEIDINNKCMNITILSNRFNIINELVTCIFPLFLEQMPSLFACVCLHKYINIYKFLGNIAI